MYVLKNLLIIDILPLREGRLITVPHGQEPTCSSTVADNYNTTDKSGKLISDDVDRKENDTEVISRNMVYG